MISHETLVRHEKPGNLPRGGLVCQQTPAPGTESRGFLNTYTTHIFKCASTVHIKVFVLNYIVKRLIKKQVSITFEYESLILQRQIIKL
jgi:hypothetical protein